jgi:hypothetical protein
MEAHAPLPVHPRLLRHPGLGAGRAALQTDDPTPVDYGHYEAYLFGTVDGTPAELDPVAPAFEFNWGAVPNIQLHAILPFGAVIPSNNPIYAPGGQGPSAYGLIDMEFGFKYGFIKQTKHRPQIGSFTMFEIPTGRYSRGLGVGKVWYKLPLWMAKDIGPWSLDAGAGYTVVSQTGYRNFPYGGFLVKRVVSKKLELSAGLLPRARRLRRRADRSLNHDRRRRLLPFQITRPATTLRLRPLHRRPDRELWLSRSL